MLWPTPENDCLVRVLVINEDPTIATSLAASLAPDSWIITACRDIALAESATDMGDFDLFFIGLADPTEEDRIGLGAIDRIAAQNPTAITVLLAVDPDAGLVGAAKKKGAAAVIRPVSLCRELVPLCLRLGLPPPAANGKRAL